MTDEERDREALQAERDAAAERLEELLAQGRDLMEEARRTLAELDAALAEAPDDES